MTPSVHKMRFQSDRNIRPEPIHGFHYVTSCAVRIPRTGTRRILLQNPARRCNSATATHRASRGTIVWLPILQSPVSSYRKGQYGLCAHGSGTMVNRSVKVPYERTNYFYSLPRLHICRPAAVVGDGALHGCPAVEDFNLYLPTTVAKAVPRSVGDELGYNHSKPTAA